MTALHHLAQVNVARARAPLDDPLMKGFVDRLDEVNALADGSPGFLWRLKLDDGDATGVQAFDDERMLINLSVWESVEALKSFVYSGGHLTVLRSRAEWFERMDSPIMALWWIPAGTIPDVDDAKRALARLAAEGPTAAAFTFARSFPAPPIPLP